jgi:hypothetical protein
MRLISWIHKLLQIIMAKPAGGPRRDAQPGGGMDED